MALTARARIWGARVGERETREGFDAEPSSIEQLLDAKQVAIALGIRSRTVYSLVDQGLLPFKRVGRRALRFGEADLQELFRRSAEAAP